MRWYYSISKVKDVDKYFITRYRKPNIKHILGFVNGKEVWLTHEYVIKKGGVLFFPSNDEAEFVLEEKDETVHQIKRPPKKIRKLNK